MHHLERREQLLRRVVAVSGSLLALCLLPIAQHFLQDGKAPAALNVSPSPDAEVRANIPQDTSCTTDLQRQIADLTARQSQQLTDLEKEYQSLIEPYQAAKQALTGTPESIQTERHALDALIKEESEKYTAARAQIIQSTSQQRNHLLANCQ